MAALTRPGNLAREDGPGQVIVTLPRGSGIKYMSRIFNPEWLLAHGLDQNQPVSESETSPARDLNSNLPLASIHGEKGDQNS